MSLGLVVPIVFLIGMIAGIQIGYLLWGRIRLRRSVVPRAEIEKGNEEAAREFFEGIPGYRRMRLMRRPPAPPPYWDRDSKD